MSAKRVEYGVEICSEHAYKLRIKTHFFKVLNFINMSVMRKFEVMCENFKLVIMLTDGNYNRQK